MRFLALVAVLVASASLADVIPDDPCWRIQPGGKCNIGGAPGTCVEVTYPVRAYPMGPLTTITKMICKPTVAVTPRSPLPWFGVALAFLALCAGIATTRKDPSVESAA